MQYAARVWSAILLAVVMWGHSEVLSGHSHDVCGMTLFHGSAMLCDFFLMFALSWLLTGNVSLDMQHLCLWSMTGNFLGWILYLAYAPPVFYNVFMWGLSYVQWGRLLILDDDAADNLGSHLGRGHASIWS